MDPMSQPAPNPHTQRSVAGMVGSMIVVVVVVVGWVGFRSLISDPPSPPPRVVDWTVQARVGDQADALGVYAPEALPAGWTAKDARYSGGAFPKWELALRTAGVRTISITETVEPGSKIVSDIDDDAVQGEDVTLDGVVWQTWKFKRGDYGLSRSVTAPTGAAESVLVHGSAPQEEIREFARTLRPTNPAPKAAP